MTTDPADRVSNSSPPETTLFIRDRGHRPQSSWVKGLSVVVLGTVVAFLVLFGLKQGWLVNTGLWQNSASKLTKTEPSSGVGVTTAVLTVYILFIGGFATLVGFVTRGRGPPRRESSRSDS